MNRKCTRRKYIKFFYDLETNLWLKIYKLQNKNIIQMHTPAFKINFCMEEKLKPEAKKYILTTHVTDKGFLNI